MSDIELTDEQKTDFAVLFGSLFSLDLVLNYFEGLEPIFTSRRANYANNKLKEATVAVNALNKVITREFYKSCSWSEEYIFRSAIETQQQLVYGIMGLDPDKQEQIRQLVQKLMEE